jgi:4-hydroxy-tetrahydrodipicolinate reductase
MQLIIYGPGRLGRAIAPAAIDAGWPAPVMIGRPDAGDRSPSVAGDVVIDASTGSAVAGNVAHALAAGNRAFVIAATGWDEDRSRVRAMLAEHEATAVVAPNLSLGAALFLRLVETAAGWFGPTGAFEPSVVEWHRRGKGDRPSGTARALADRITAADPRWAAPGASDDARPAIEVAGIRAGSAPGSHLVTFDGAGESIELRLTARDRSAYADGALAAARWLARAPHDPGMHPFDAVVDDLLAPLTAVAAA